MKYTRVRKLIKCLEGNPLPTFNDATGKFEFPDNSANLKGSVKSSDKGTPLNFKLLFGNFLNSDVLSQGFQQMRNLGVATGNQDLAQMGNAGFSFASGNYYGGATQTLDLAGNKIFGDRYNNTANNFANTAIQGLGTINPALGFIGKGVLFGLNAIDSGLGSTTREFSANSDTIEKVGGAYGGTVNDINKAVSMAGLKHGAFSNLFHNTTSRANKYINEVSRKLNKMTNIANDVSDWNNMSINMTQLNSTKYQNEINGGYDLRYTYKVAKEGGILEKEFVPIITEPVDIFKEGGIIIEPKEEFIPIITDPIDIHKYGGQLTDLKSLIPEGALHARKHNMENDENITKKGIPVVDIDGNLQCEIECNEIIFTLEVTKKLEELYQKNTDEAAIEAGKLLVNEILFNTDDRTELIKKTDNGTE